MLDPWLAGKSAGAAAATLMAILMAALISKSLFSYTHAQANVRIQESVVRDLRRKLFDRLLIVDLGFFQQTRVGQLLAVILSDADQVKTAVSAALASLLQNVTIIVITLVILLSLSARLTLLTLAMAPLLLGLVQLLVRRLRRHAAQSGRGAGAHDRDCDGAAGGDEAHPRLGQCRVRITGVR